MPGYTLTVRPGQATQSSSRGSRVEWHLAVVRQCNVRSPYTFPSSLHLILTLSPGAPRGQRATVRLRASSLSRLAHHCLACLIFAVALIASFSNGDRAGFSRKQQDLASFRSFRLGRIPSTSNRDLARIPSLAICPTRRPLLRSGIGTFNHHYFRGLRAGSINPNLIPCV